MPRNLSPLEALRAPIERRIEGIRGFRAAEVVSYNPLEDYCDVRELVFAGDSQTLFQVPVLRFEGFRKDLTPGQHVLVGNFELDHTDYLSTGEGGEVVGGAHRVSPFVLPVARLADPDRAGIARPALTVGTPEGAPIPVVTLTELLQIYAVLTALAAGSPADPITRGVIAAAIAAAAPTPPTGSTELAVTS